MAAVTDQLTGLQQRADKHELTVAGLKASLAAKEQVEVSVAGLSEQLEECTKQRKAEKQLIQQKDTEKKTTQENLEALQKEKEVIYFCWDFLNSNNN